MTWPGVRTRRRSNSVTLIMLLVSALAFIMSLGTVLRAYAMPVEARTTESWYSYNSVIGFGFTAKVAKSRYYPDTTVTAEQLLKVRGPVDPPVYRRVLISPLTDSVQVQIPYSFHGDRPADIKAKFRVDGQLIVPGVWQQPIPFVQEKELATTGTDISGTENFSVSIKQLLADMDSQKNDLKISVEPVEVHIRPSLSVEVAGLKQPLRVANDTEYLMNLRTTTLEIDDPRESKQDKVLSETRVVPITIGVLGTQIKVSVLRQISLTALFFFLAMGAIMFFLRRKKPDGRSLLQRLGPNLLVVRSFELPGDTAVAEVRSAKELIQIQTQTERPVIKVGTTYYLLDGTTCYRYVLGNDENVGSDD